MVNRELRKYHESLTRSVRSPFTEVERHGRACTRRKRLEIGSGGFNFMPAKMVHEAWLPADSLTFITVDGPWDVNWVVGPPTTADLTK